MAPKSRDSAILLIHCPDRKGIVAAVTQFISSRGGNILYLDQYVDAARSMFFMRIEWDLASFSVPPSEIRSVFEDDIGRPFNMQWSIYLSGDRPKMAIFVSKLSHCLYDILSRCQSGEWQVEVPLIISNHPDLEPVASAFGIDYHHIPVNPENKAEQEARQVELLKSHDIDFVVLARYMQILSAGFVSQFPNRIINIHHAFLPAFPGARPYHSAYERGVKIIGATSHYVTAELDAGPIIVQDVTRVSHHDEVEDLVRMGRDLEKTVLAGAVWKHIQRKVLAYENRTVVFT